MGNIIYFHKRPLIARMLGLPLIPADREELTIMLRAFMIQNAVRELGYDLNNCSDLVYLSLRGIEMLLKECRCS